MIIYQKENEKVPSVIRKVELAVKTYIENESTFCKTRRTVCNSLFNIENARYSGDDPFIEGKLDEKYPEKVRFMKEFAINKDMLEECERGDFGNTKRRAEHFTRSYYKERDKLCEAALINGERTEMDYNGEKLDISTLWGDEALFSGAHKWGKEDEKHGVQSNFFYGDVLSSEEKLEAALKKLCGKLQDIKDEGGYEMGYVADTIIIPCNRPELEQRIKNVIGIDDNDIDVQYGKWNLVVLNSWTCDCDKIMIMSSEANKCLMGNVLFNRVPLTVSHWVDSHTGNYIWNGRCRFGVGFGSYKHILLAVDSKEKIDGATPIE